MKLISIGHNKKFWSVSAKKSFVIINGSDIASYYKDRYGIKYETEFNNLMLFHGSVSLIVPYVTTHIGNYISHARESGGISEGSHLDFDSNSF